MIMNTIKTSNNADLIRRGYGRFARRDIDTVLAILDPDITWHAPGRSPLSGDYKGHSQVLGFLMKVAQRSAGTFRIDIADVLAAGERVVVSCTGSAERDGQSLSAPQVHVWQMDGERAVDSGRVWPREIVTAAERAGLAAGCD